MLLNRRIYQKYAIIFLVAVLAWLDSPCQAVVDWKDQVVQFYETGSSSDNEDDQNWFSISNKKQGVYINVIPTEKRKIYIEKGNAVVKFGNRIRAEADGIIQFCSHFNYYSFSFTTDFGQTVDLISQQPMSCNEAEIDVSSIFQELGEFDVTIKWTYWGANTSQIYERKYTFCVVPKSDKLFLNNHGNTMRMWKSNLSESRPILLSPGFDAHNVKSEQYYRFAGDELFNCLLSNGFDIYVLYYKYNPQDLRKNAAVYSSAARFISTNYFSSQDIISAGISMGGLITRYAIVKAEDENNTLPIDTWISLDAPHQGAYISAELQNFLKENSDDDFSNYLNNNDAAKIMLHYNAYDVGGVLKSNFYNDLYSRNGNGGFPKQCNTIGVSFSNDENNPASGAWLAISLSWFWGGSYTKYITLEETEMEAGSYMPPLQIDDRAFNDFSMITQSVNQYLNPAFMPHKSTLDYDNNGNTKFDKTIIPQETGFHDRIPSELVPEIVDAIIPENKYIQNKIFTGNISIYSKYKIWSGFNVTSEIDMGNVVLMNNSSVKLEAGDEISFTPGFEVKYGALFEAKINTPYFNCGSNEFIYYYDNDLTHPIENSKNKLVLNSEIYPNPCSEYIEIIINQSLLNLLSITLMDLTGKAIKQIDINRISGENNSFIIDVKDLMPGVYYLNVTFTNNTKQLHKFIKT